MDIKLIRVLILDDNKADAIYLLRMLKALSLSGIKISVRAFEEPDDARSALSCWKPHVAFVDYQLGVVSGTDVIEAFTRIRPNAEYILLTGMGGEEPAVGALRAGAGEYVTKAAISTQLEPCVRHAVNRYLSRKAVRETEAKFHAIYDESLDALLIVGAESGEILQANKTAQPTLGYQPEELTGKRLLELFVDRHDESVEDFMQRTCVSDAVFHAQEFRHADGSVRYLDVSAKMIPWGEAGDQAILVNLRDVTSNLATEKALVQSETRYQQMLQTVSSYRYSVQLRNGKATGAYHAPGCLQVTGYTAKEYEAQDNLWFQMIYEEDRPRVLQALEEFFASGSMPMLEHRIRHKNGSIRWIRQTVIPHHNSRGRLVRYDGLVEDITKRREAEQALRESESKYRTMMETMDEQVYIISTNHQIEYMNKAAKQHLERDATGELCYKAIFCQDTPCDWCRHHLPDSEIDAQGVQEVYAGDRTYHISTTRLPHNDGTLSYMSIMRDITALRQAEKARHRLASAVEQATEMMVITDTDGRIEYVNPAFEEVTGYRREEVEGRTPALLKSGMHSDSFYRNLWQTIEQGYVWKGRFVNRKKSGALYEEEASITPLRSDGSGVVNYIAVKRDITQEKNMEEQLRQAQKMQAIGTLAGGIAHDFNNILSAIMGYTDMAFDKVAPENRASAYLKQVQLAGKRAAELVQQILAFSRQTEEEKHYIEPHLIIKEALKLLRASLPSTISIEQNIATDLGYVLADPTQMHQVVMNLCTNAYHAMRGSGGTLGVDLEAFLLGEATPAHPGLDQGDYAKLTVSDTGHGIPKDILDRVFEPFFTTKNVGEGTGMGLAVVHGIVTGLGGWLDIRSEEGKGTSVCVLLPVVSRTKEDNRRQIDKTLSQGQAEIVFVVDDEEVLVDMCTEMLEDIGYRTRGFVDSREALRTFLDDPSCVDLVLTDQTMPELTGTQLASRMLATRPDLPIVMMTGYSEHVSAEKAKQIGIAEFLMKPVGKKGLAATLHKALGQTLTS